MLEVKDLRKSFKDNEVLKGINLKIEKGDIICIIGSSGCGKSTFIRCINFIETPTSGKVIFNNKEYSIEDKDIYKLREKVGMVFQQFNLFPHLTVLENITLAPIKHNIMTKEDANKEAIKLLKLINLESKKDNYPKELSGGEKQRIAIIRTLIMKPDIILFDEPTSALDPQMVKEVLELIKDIAKRGMTMLIVSHEMEFVRNIATKVIFLNNGVIEEEGSVDEVFGNPKSAKLKEFLSNIS